MECGSATFLRGPGTEKTPQQVFHRQGRRDTSNSKPVSVFDCENLREPCCRKRVISQAVSLSFQRFHTLDIPTTIRSLTGSFFSFFASFVSSCTARPSWPWTTRTLISVATTLHHVINGWVGRRLELVCDNDDDNIEQQHQRCQDGWLKYAALISAALPQTLQSLRL